MTTWGRTHCLAGWLAHQCGSQACRVAVATGWSQFAVATELADYRGVDANRGGLPIPRTASVQARRHGRPAGQHRWRRSWRAQWASIPAGLRARGSRCRWLTVAGVNAAAAHGLCGNRELASARRYGHPLRQRVGQRGAGQSGLPCWRTNLVRKLVGWLWRQAGAHSRLPQSWLTIVVLTPAEVACHYLEPRARRPVVTDARRASTGGGVLGERSGRPYRPAYALAVRGVGGLPWLALTPVLLSSSVATANWLQPAGMATHCANEWVGVLPSSPDFPALAPSRSQACRVAVATGWSQFAVATELADYRGADANRGGLPIPRTASVQARRHGRPAGRPRWIA